MAGIATKSAFPDDPLMSDVRGQRSGDKYTPPSKSGEIMLSDALNGTGRLEQAKQLDFLGDSDSPGDLRIYYAGDLSLLKRPCVSVVGTRQVSKSGTVATEWVARKLADAGVVVVSGLAYGVDTVAHTSAISQGGKTIAVIGTPLDMASPSENGPLQERIYREDLLISQFRKGERPQRASFPIRNRLMAVLSDATVVMEASDTSGTLHQAAECTRLGRWLFIAKSVADDSNLSWPKKFLKYKTCVVLEKVSQITDRILRSSQ